MKRICIGLCVCLTFLSSCSAEDKPKVDKKDPATVKTDEKTDTKAADKADDKKEKKEQLTAKEAATAYITAVMTGDLKKMNALSKVPYCLGRASIIKEIEKLKAFHDGVVKSKGKREMPKHSVKKVEDFEKLNEETFEDPYEVYRLTFTDGKHKGFKLDIYVVKDGESHKVIGFRE